MPHAYMLKICFCFVERIGVALNTDAIVFNTETYYEIQLRYGRTMGTLKAQDK